MVGSRGFEPLRSVTYDVPALHLTTYSHSVAFSGQRKPKLLASFSFKRQSAA